MSTLIERYTLESYFLSFDIEIVKIESISVAKDRAVT